MRITEAEVISIALPFRERYRTASGELDSRSMAILRVSTADDHTGLGEAVPMTLRGGPGLAQIAAELARCAERLEGADPTAAGGEPAGVRSGIEALLIDCAALGASPQALCAVDGALHDLAGRVLGLPVWELLGAGEARPVECNATLDAGEAEVVERTARAQHEAGFRTFKVKVGIDGDAERVAAVRRAVGEAAVIRIDANGAWSVEEAIAAIGELEAFELELAEQPCADLRGLAALRARTGVPIVADESVASLEDAGVAVSLGACDAATLKLSKVGGPLAALRIAAAVPSYLSSALDGPIGIAAALHVAQALPHDDFASGLAHGLGTLEMFAATYAAHEGLYGPSLLPPAGPGLGVEIDEARLEELRIP